MRKGKIVLLPLDERPCNYNYPLMMPKSDYEIIVPPKEIIWKSLHSHCACCCNIYCSNYS